MLSINPKAFAFSPANAAWCPEQMKKYPPGRQASAVIPILWRGQEQEGWVTKPMVEEVGRMLGMPYVRVLEVATFYTMFKLQPVGTWLVQACTTTPCWLRGSDAVVGACKSDPPFTRHMTVAPDGKIAWVEMECLGACVNAPMVLIDKDPYGGFGRRRKDGIDHHPKKPGSQTAGARPKPERRHQVTEVGPPAHPQPPQSSRRAARRRHLPPKGNVQPLPLRGRVERRGLGEVRH